MSESRSLDGHLQEVSRVINALRTLGLNPAQGPGSIEFLGEGVFRRVYRVVLEAKSAKARGMVDVAILLPRSGQEGMAARTARAEAPVLTWLGEQRATFQSPQVLGWVNEPPSESRGGDFPPTESLVVVQTCMPGIPVVAGMAPPPWEVLGRAAAGLHSLDASTLRTQIPGLLTRRAHALQALAILDEVEDDAAREAATWARAWIPPEDTTVLLHGDLLGQNVLVQAEGGVAIIDWAAALIGDPACEFALMTRASPEPFGRFDGLDLLLSACRAAGGNPPSRNQVRLYELALLGTWLGQALLGRPGAGSVDGQRDELSSHLGRCRVEENDHVRSETP